MELPRESLLPTIKCSACGRHVEISMMGDHLCAGATAELSPPPDADDGFEDHFNQPSYGKYGRTPPPVDTDAANRPFMNRGQLTPVSQPSVSRSVSPITPNVRPTPSRTDNYFAPSPAQPRRPGGYGGFGGQAKEEAEPGLGKQGGAGLLDRMNLIAPGPFDANRRPAAARNAFPTRKDSLEKLDAPPMEELSRPMDRPGTSHSNSSGGGSITMAPPRVPRKNGYGGFGPPSSTAGEFEPSTPGLISRSETYPKPSVPSEPPARMPSAPGARPDRSRDLALERKVSMGPDMSRKPPPRTSLLAQHRPKNSGSVDLAAEFGVGNPYHTPSGSASSGYSTFSHRSQASSLTSPARSQTYRNDLDPLPKVDKAMGELQTSTESLRPRDLRIDLKAQTPRRTPSPLMESPHSISPLQERHDPAIQLGKLDLQARDYDRPLPSLPSAHYGSSPQRGPDPMRTERRNDHSQGRIGISPPARQEAPLSLRKASRDPILPSRGDCKACGLAIRGKSISSADGRLTGKYHKACFVCTTCSEPFASAEFYVLGDRPYCEQHYHKLNGSLCGGCGRGIEGQYLEDESRIKYHVGCFRCLDCGMSLSGGYFEVDGKSYCERDAMKRSQVPSNGHGMAEHDAYPHRGGPGSRLAPGTGGRGDRPGFRAGPGGLGMPRPPYGAQYGSRLGAGTGPRMNKRMTRLGQM